MKFVPTAIILSVVLATSLLFAMVSIQSVDAVKSSGTKNQQYGKTAHIRVCGTHFCASDPSLNREIVSEKNIPTEEDLDAIFQRMDKIKKQHQMQLSEQWRLMTNAEKVQFIHKMNQMLSYMESMDMMEHMNKMGSHNGMKEWKNHGGMMPKFDDAKNKMKSNNAEN
ncbi:MAG: hypothetical protein ACT4OD_06155 [Candidatus Nitrosotenuis sp.]